MLPCLLALLRRGRRLLLLVRRWWRWRWRREARGGPRLDVIDQAGRVALAAELVRGDRPLALLGERSLLHWDRVLLGIEADSERELIGQASVEGDVSVVVGPEEVDGAGQ